MVKEFLLLEEITKNSPSLPQEEKNPSVEIQNLTCYWDKVRFTQSNQYNYVTFYLHVVCML